MKAVNKFLTLLTLSTGAAASIAAINKVVKVSALSGHILANPDTPIFKWRLGNISYTKTGTGKPLLLIHDIHPASGKYEWEALSEYLKEKYTIYTIDLLGCGCSEKPNITYTNYLYVQLVSDFIKSEIGRRTSVLTMGEAGAVSIMACADNPDLFDKLILINPLSLVDCSMIPGSFAKTYKFLMDAPLIGTLIYNFAVTRKNILDKLNLLTYRDAFPGKQSILDSGYEAAHLGNYPRALFMSQYCNYTKCNIVRALSRINNSICLIGGKEIPQIAERLEEYQTYNPAVEIAYVPETKQLPHIERPERLFEVIKDYL